MERAEVRFDLIVLISFFMHIIIMISFLILQIRSGVLSKSAAESLFKGRDIIVNINQDGSRM